MDRDELAIRKMLVGAKERSRLEQLNQNFESNLCRAYDSPSMALELLRQLCLCSRAQVSGKPALAEDLIILVEGADLLLPEGDIGRLSDADRHRIAICQDWFSDPDFMVSGDSVVMLAESTSLVNHRVTRLPQVLETEVPSPTQDIRKHCIAWHNHAQPAHRRLQLWGSQNDLARLTAGLNIHALLQLCKAASHSQELLQPSTVIAKVEQHIRRELGEDVVEFKKPGHGLDAVVGFHRLKKFLQTELIPRLKMTGSGALAGAAVCGPIGAGKTFLFEAVATELDVVVLVLKNIRSKWFGGTDVLFERLRRVLEALSKVLIFVDEADTQFGGVGPQTHDTERRLTGKIQALMSDSSLRGRVAWLLMTARIHLLSPDLRRPGRVGDLIIPVLDPEDSERDEFLEWMLQQSKPGSLPQEVQQGLLEATRHYSAASYASMRSELAALAAQMSASGGSLAPGAILERVQDHIPAR